MESENDNSSVMPKTMFLAAQMTQQQEQVAQKNAAVALMSLCSSSSSSSSSASMQYSSFQLDSNGSNISSSNTNIIDFNFQKSIKEEIDRNDREFNNQYLKDSTIDRRGSNTNKRATKRKIGNRDPLLHRQSERRRRERINAALTSLREILLNSFLPKFVSPPKRGRIEKTELIQTAIKYIRHLQEMSQPLNSSPNANESDELFRHCRSQSAQLESLCIRDRFRFHQLGFQECMLEAAFFLKSQSDNFPSLAQFQSDMIEHLQRYKDSIDTCIILKHMKNGTGSSNFPTENDQSQINFQTNENQNIDMQKHRVASAAELRSSDLCRNDESDRINSIATKSSPCSFLLPSSHIVDVQNSIENSSPMIPITASPSPPASSSFGSSLSMQAYIINPSLRSSMPFRIKLPIIDLHSNSNSPNEDNGPKEIPCSDVNDEFQHSSLKRIRTDTSRSMQMCGTAYEMSIMMNQEQLK